MVGSIWKFNFTSLHKNFPSLLLCIFQACKSVGLSDPDAQTLVSKIKDQEVKDLLKKTSEDAVEHGASRVI